eukprot:COSAG02_NODE_7572_length_2956_cov_1.241862_1_plen_64_part_10
MGARSDGQQCGWCSYINGPLAKWRHESETGLRTDSSQPQQRERYDKHIAIANTIGARGARHMSH